MNKVYSLYKNSDYTCLLNVIIFLYFIPIIFLIRCMIVVIYSFSILRECFKFYLFIYYMSRLQFSPPSSLAIHSSSYLPLPLSIHSSSVSAQKEAVLPRMPIKHGISSFEQELAGFGWGGCRRVLREMTGNGESRAILRSCRNLVKGKLPLIHKDDPSQDSQQQ